MVKAERRRGRHTVPAIFVALLLVLSGFMVGASIGDGQIQRAATAFVLVWLGCIVLLASGHSSGLYRPTVMYLIVFGLFHGGLLVSVALRGRAGLVVSDGGDWLYGPDVPSAVRYSMLGCAAFAVGAGVAMSGRGPAMRSAERTRSVPAPISEGGRIGVVGLAAELTGLTLVVSAIGSGGGVSVLRSGYSAYLSAAQNSSRVSYGVFLIGIGTVLAVLGTRRQARSGLILFLLFAAVAFPLGLRGDVLFPAAVIVVIWVRVRGRPIRYLVAAPLVLAILLAIGIVRQTRVGGFGALVHTSAFVSPLDAVGEMGYSLYPSVVVQQWHADGERFAHGVTLIAVPIRFVERLTDWHGGPPLVDFRLFNVEMLTRVGPAGGSPIAEGYHNGGVIGVLLLMGMIGFVVSSSERVARTARSNAILAAILLPLFIEIRGAFAPVPVELVFGIAVVFAADGLPRRAVQPHQSTGGGQDPLDPITPVGGQAVAAAQLSHKITNP